MARPRKIPIEVPGIRVKVIKDGVWLVDSVRAAIGDEQTISAEDAELLESLGYVDIL